MPHIDAVQPWGWAAFVVSVAAMPSPDYPYDGTFLSELAAIGRVSLTIACRPCSHSRTRTIADFLAEHGDVVLPHALSLVTARCKLRGSAANVSCEAVFADPLTVDEEAAIKAGRV